MLQLPLPGAVVIAGGAEWLAYLGERKLNEKLLG